MKFLFKMIVYILVFLVFLFVFLPKQNIYFKAEELISKQGVIISDEVVNDGFNSLEISAAEVYFKDVYFANINKIEMRSLLFLTKINIDQLRFSPSISKMAPSPISKISITHSILDITKARIVGNSDFGSLDGYIDFLNKKVVLTLDANSKMKRNYSNILRMMKQKDGRYTYEYNY